MHRRPALLSLAEEHRYVAWLREHAMEGTFDSAALATDLASDLEARAAKRRARMAPEGALGLQPLLEFRRLEYGIPDGAFRVQAAYDRVLLWQISQYEGKGTFGDTSILMPDSTRDYERGTAPRGVVVSAGLRALDHLRSNGVDLGHVVAIGGLSPWRIRCDSIGGRPQHVLLLASGDVAGSEDTRRLLDNGYATTECMVLEGGAPAHFYRSTEEGSAEPTLPQQPYKTFEE